MKNQLNQQSLLEEIFIAPAKEIITERFREDNNATCRGECNGVCGSVFDS